MPFLRIEPRDCVLTASQSASTHSKSLSGDPEDQKMVLNLRISAEKMAEFSESIAAIRAKEGSELRTELPDGWTIFWKVRLGESRFFVARPEIGQWVATLALSPTHFESFQALLRESGLAAGVECALSSLEKVSRMSNLEVILGVGPPGSAA